jgi:predicted transglutaminase-like cysteine proteinase
MPVIFSANSSKRATACSLAILCGFGLALATARLCRADIDGFAYGILALPTPRADGAARGSDGRDDDQATHLASLDAGAVDFATSELGGHASTASGEEPFGVLKTAAASDERLSANWSRVRREIASDADLLARCRVDAARCPSVGAARFLAIIAAARTRDGRARLGEVNRAINLAIRPMSDLAQYGVIDRWAAPLDALARGAGDCEDYAFAKCAALRASGIGEEDLRLVVVRDVKLREDHAVLAARRDGRWLILDNRRLLMLEDSQLPNYVPLFTLGIDGIRRVDGRRLAAGRAELSLQRDRLSSSNLANSKSRGRDKPAI